MGTRRTITVTTLFLTILFTGSVSSELSYAQSAYNAVSLRLECIRHCEPPWGLPKASVTFMPGAMRNWADDGGIYMRFTVSGIHVGNGLGRFHSVYFSGVEDPSLFFSASNDPIAVQRWIFNPDEGYGYTLLQPMQAPETMLSYPYLRIFVVQERDDGKLWDPRDGNLILDGFIETSRLR